MKKNDYYDHVECIDYTHDGQGIVKIDGFPVFVKNMLIDEIGKVKIIKVLKNYAVGRLIDLDVKSVYRIEARCPIFKQCGGCHIQHMSAQGQQIFKTRRVQETLQKIGHCFVDVHPCLMMNDPWFYRNKIQVPVGEKEGQMITGFYKQHSNEIIPYDICYIQNHESHELVNRVKELLMKVHEKPYDKVHKVGNIKHILVKYGNKTNEFMLVLITYRRKIKGMNHIVNSLIKEFPYLKTIIQNINPRHDNVILGDDIHIWYGPGYIEDKLFDNNYRISTHSFYQINPIQVEVLYQKAIEYAQFQPTDIVIDAYCGIGTIALSLASYVSFVYGVEIVEQAIVDAKDNALRNKINNVEFLCQDAGDFMIDMVKKKQHVDVVMLDPPRKGCSQVFLKQLVTLSPQKIIYISCDVATQARDIAFLQDHGYEVDLCQPVDMFPQSFHIENICRIIKKL